MAESLTATSDDCAANNAKAEGSAIEEALRAIWKALLGVDSVGVDENFFKLGGQSLMAPILLQRVWEEFSVHLPYFAVFRHPTIREQAQLVQSVRLQSDGEDRGNTQHGFVRL